MATKGQLQKILVLIVKIAEMAGAAVAAINGLWKLLNEDGRLTESMRNLLNSLKASAAIKEPTEKLRQQLSAVDEYVREQPDMSSDQAHALRKRIQDCQRRLSLAAALDGSARRRVIKGVKRDVADLLKQTLTHGTLA